MQATTDSGTRRMPIAGVLATRQDLTMSPGHQALRKGRWSESGRAYIVTFTTFERQRLFDDFRVARAACHAIANSLPADHGTLMCWVLMPDHFHAVVRLTGQATLPRCVQRIKGRSSMACSQAMQRHVPIWARAFHDHAVRADEDLPDLVCYVIANPVRAGIAKDVLVYPWWNAEWL